MTSTGVEQPHVMLLQPGPTWVSRCAVLPLQSYLISVSDSTKLFSPFSVLLVLCVSSGKLQIFAEENKTCYIAVSWLFCFPFKHWESEVGSGIFYETLLCLF